MIIDETLLAELLEQAAQNGRRRANHDLRTSCDDSSQRMLNALLPGTQVPIHRHRESTETLLLLRGRLTTVFYDEKGEVCAQHELCPTDGRFGLQIPKGQWHSVVVEEPCLIFEAKDGAYQALAADDVMKLDIIT